RSPSCGGRGPGEPPHDGDRDDGKDGLAGNVVLPPAWFATLRVSKRRPAVGKRFRSIATILSTCRKVPLESSAPARHFVVFGSHSLRLRSALAAGSFVCLVPAFFAGFRPRAGCPPLV